MVATVITSVARERSEINIAGVCDSSRIRSPSVVPYRRSWPPQVRAVGGVFFAIEGPRPRTMRAGTEFAPELFVARRVAGDEIEVTRVSP